MISNPTGETLRAKPNTRRHRMPLPVIALRLGFRQLTACYAQKTF
jgi:hypothetical protein